MDIITEITYEDFREKRESCIIKFNTEETFQEYINDIFDDNKFYSFNSLMLTTDNKIIILKRRTTFVFDMVFNCIITPDRYKYSNFINMVKSLSYNEQNLIKKIIDDLEYNIDEVKTKQNLYTELNDKKFVRKLYVISKYIYNNHKMTFEKIHKRNNQFIPRKLRIKTKLCNMEISLKKNKDVFVLPGGKKNKKDISYKDTIHRETYEELGEKIKFELEFDNSFIARSKIYDKNSRKTYIDITFLCKINKTYIEISENFKKNKEINDIEPVHLDVYTFSPINNLITILLLSVLKNLN